ncbi:hypothetical protein EIN_320060 [Entamoeba invadens IP1]|uniref:VHS domain-containing protein n=1 Tax=Entamoeba invadens IP1 TaxID=370355 RepID=A0A0A1TZM7_ENTIV|nr:hypothetical protein EIN_320060 [Entamoeba invadens IP1]ELP87037.1 hypothetical protein EIN_320060 [Entamoeba invadens IP1]|eukprot:XP_004253808.1 hypothetical protein EIN_320060 [Entamoeba invadens IP1]
MNAKKNGAIKKKITWDMAAQLVEYATATDLRIIDHETNERICAILNVNKTKAKDLLNVLRKRMLNKKDSVVRLALELMQQTLTECPDVVEFYATDMWQDCFITTVLKKNVMIDTKMKLLSIVRGLAEQYPSMLIFVDTYNQMKQHGIEFPAAASFIRKEVEESKVPKSTFMEDCEKLRQYCEILNQTFDYLTIPELKELKNDELTIELVGKLQRAVPVINDVLSKRTTGSGIRETLEVIQTQVYDTLARHKNLTEKADLVVTDKKLVENTEFMYESKKFR